MVPLFSFSLLVLFVLHCLVVHTWGMRLETAPGAAVSSVLSRVDSVDHLPEGVHKGGQRNEVQSSCVARGVEFE